MRPTALNSATALRLYAASALLLYGASAMPAQTLPPGFRDSVVFSGLTQPTAVAFSPDGRVFVAEKSGRIKVFSDLSDTTATNFADLRTRTHNYWDRGMLGLALHPDFPSTPYVYVLYTHDAEIGGTAPRWGTAGETSDPCPTPPGGTGDGCVVSGRLSRLQASGDVMIGTEQVLIEDWFQQYPSHSIGSLFFGPDGALYASGGDGASFLFVDYGQDGDPLNPGGDPPVPVGGIQTPPTAEGGALRSQDLRTSGDPVTLDGTVIRIDPMTGAGLPDNPFAGDPDPNARRVIAYGLRNPFRMTPRPGTSEIWVGDVGLSTWEEINRIGHAGDSAVENFGWPCYEGVGQQTSYASTDLNICEDLYDDAGAVTAPYYTYNHSTKVVPGEPCSTGSSAVTGLAFYTGASYPSAYQNALFFADYSRRCVWAMLPGVGGDPDPSNLQTFISAAGTPVQLTIGPGGDLFYVDISGGKIHRIQYFVPTAVIAADPTSGTAPLTVQFDATGSTHPNPGEPLTFSWDLDGDGTYGDSTDPQPIWTYDSPGTYTVRLQVTDSHGGMDTDQIGIDVDNTPPVATIDVPSPSLTWKVGDEINFDGSATDVQDGPLPAAALSWAIILHHCPSDCHAHTIQTFDGVATGSFNAEDHEYPSYLEVRLTATDSGSLQGTASVLLYPMTVSLTFQSSPPGLQLVSGSISATAPFSQTVIVGSSNSISAPSPQTLGGQTYSFLSWSDGGLPSHNVTAPAAPTTYTASYFAADLSATVTADPEPICTGATLVYTVTVTNSGPTEAASVSVSDPLPAGTTLVSAEGSGWSCDGTSTVVCTRPLLTPGTAPDIIITVSAPSSAGPVNNVVTVGSATGDPNTSNNSSNATTTVETCTASIENAAPNSGPPDGGTEVTLLGANFQLGATVTVGGAPATGVTVTSETEMSFLAPAASAGTLNDIVVTNPDSSTGTLVNGFFADFLDVPAGHLFHDFVERIFRNGVTAGCGGGNYCPDDAVTRAQMAVFLLKSKHGAVYAPPPATGTVFGDVPADAFAADWIEQLAAEGITSGCGGGNFCPASPVTREQMAVFLLKAEHGASYTPPPATGVFSDVPISSPYARWIEQLYAEGITAGCGGGQFCPGQPNTRGQMAVFLVKTFSLP